jgi:hypothetical protein
VRVRPHLGGNFDRIAGEQPRVAVQISDDAYVWRDLGIALDEAADG